jgi:signal transduction histidine kinase
MEPNVKILAASIAAVVNLTLIVLISLRNRKHVVYRSFIMVSACLLFWNLRVIISGLSDPGNTSSLYGLAITHIFYPMVTGCLYILPVAALQFTTSIIASDSTIMRRVVKTAYVAALAMSLVFASGILSSWLYDRLLWLFILPLFSLSLFLLSRAFVRSRRPLERTRFGLLIVAGAIGVAGAISEDILISSGMNAGGLGSIANATYSLIVAACLLQHRLFDVAVTTKRALGILISAALLILVSYLIAEIFRFREMMPYGHVLITVLILLALGHKIVPLVERILFRSIGSSRHIVDEIRRSFDVVSNVNDALRATVETTMGAIGTAGCLCVARDAMSGQFTSYCASDAKGERAFHSEEFQDFTRWLESYASDEPVIYDEICHHLRFDRQDDVRRKNMAQAAAEMQRIGYEMYVPLASDTELLGIMFLDNKTNGFAFAGHDIRMAKTIAYNCMLHLQRLMMAERIRQLEVLATLGEMAACVAHEIRNPLAVIRSSAQIARSASHDARSSSMIIDECDRLDRVVTRTLDFTRTQKPKPQSVDIQQEIERWAADIVDSSAPKGVRLRVECPQRIPAVMFDPDHLEQIVTNLILNAIEAIDGEGMIEIILARSDDMVTLVIRDNGAGISREDMGNIFKPFYTTKTGGSGLGLPITRRLLELNHGTIDIRSTTDRGCTVTVRLPVWSAGNE